jgi:hypothetical protein
MRNSKHFHLELREQVRNYFFLLFRTNMATRLALKPLRVGRVLEGKRILASLSRKTTTQSPWKTTQAGRRQVAPEAEKPWQIMANNESLLT